MKQQFLEAGQIVRTHGVRGELVLEPWADSPEFLAGVKHLYFDRGETDAGVMASRVHKGRLLITLPGPDRVKGCGRHHRQGVWGAAGSAAHRRQRCVPYCG